MKALSLLLFALLLAIVGLSMASMAQVEGGGPWIDVDRSGFALAWRVVANGREVCKSPFINTRERLIECD